MLEYVQFGHTTGHHWSLWVILICGGLLTSQGYYHDPGRKSDNKHIGEVNTHHISESNVRNLVIAEGRMSMSMYSHTTKRSEIKTSHLAQIQTSHQLTK